MRRKTRKEQAISEARKRVQSGFIFNGDYFHLYWADKRYNFYYTNNRLQFIGHKEWWEQ